MSQPIKHLIKHISKAYIGNPENIALLIMALLANGHILLEDVPGTGKTTLSLALAKSIQGNFKRISCTPDVMPSDIIGFSVYNPKTGQFDYKDGPIVSNVFLVDEINRMPPKSQSGLLEAMQERAITIDNHHITLPSPFIVIATQNPIEYLGTYALPEAQLDRFIAKIKLGYPTIEQEISILKNHHITSPLASISPLLSLDAIKMLQKEVESVMIKDEVLLYITNLINASRNHSLIALGLSTRACLNVATMAKAHAFYQERDYVTPDDVKAIFIPTTAHRIILNRDAIATEVTPESLLQSILNQMPIRGYYDPSPNL